MKLFWNSYVPAFLDARSGCQCSDSSLLLIRWQRSVDMEVRPEHDIVPRLGEGLFVISTCDITLYGRVHAI